MGYFDDALDFIDSLPEIALESTKEAFRKYDFVVIDYLTNKQWFRKGEKSDGSKIKPPYARLTVKLKKAKGDPYNHITLRDKGKLYRSIDLIIGERGILLRINVEYYEKLEKKYGKKIIGIQNQYLEEFCENYIMPQINQDINDKITRIRAANTN